MINANSPALKSALCQARSLRQRCRSDGQRKRHQLPKRSAGSRKDTPRSDCRRWRLGWKMVKGIKRWQRVRANFNLIHFCSHCCTICWVSWHFLWQCCSQDGVARQPGGIDRSLALQCCWIEIVGRILFKQWVNCMWIIITPNQIRNAYDDVWRCIVLVEVSWRPVLLPLLFFSQIALLTIACRM